MSTKVKAERKRKRDDAQARQASWSLKSPESKLSSLDKRPGASKKERARILKHIEMVKAIEREKK